jgi:hypothetical protein
LYNANDFHDGMALVRDGNFQWCFIDKTGQVVIRTEERQYDQRVILRVKDADGKYGYVDKNGKQVTPYQWKDAGELRSDKTYVQDANGKYGYIDMTGKLIIPCQWSSAKDFLGDYFAHWAAVKDDNGKWGYIDKTGKLVIPCQWEATEGFSEKLAAVKDATGKWGYIDTKGNVVIPCQWYGAGYFNSSGQAEVLDKSYKKHIINKQGEIVK